MSQLGALHGRHASPGTSHDTSSTERGDAGPSLHQDDRRRAGRSIPQSQSFPTSPATSPSSRAPRSSRPIVPSPLSTPNNVAFPTSAKLSPPGLSITTGTKRENTVDLRSRGNITPTSTGGITFYTDSSNPSSPEEESLRINLPVAPNEFRNVFQPVTSRPAEGANKVTISATMASSVTAAVQGDSIPTVLARKSSIDSAISAVTSNMQSNGPSNSEQRSHDISKLITTAGSAEAAIQHLLKEKQSQSQQNSQLWRLVDKQRAMILGLNKDLEAALKDKEKYRKKLKELVANPAVIKAAASSAQGNEKQTDNIREVTILRADVDSPKGLSVALPDSPTLDTESQKASPIDMILAPYPITPPADRIHAPSSAARRQLKLDSDDQELGRLDRATDEKETNKPPVEKGDEKPKPISINVSLPPSLSLPSPSDPPKMPPPSLPDGHSTPTVNVVEPTPQPNEGLAKFPSPPRKGPPAPLQLKQEIRLHLRSASADEDTDSDYDDLLDVDDFIPEKRGRRRTREEDDREREILALREAEARSASKKSKSGKGGSPITEVPRNAPAMPTIIAQEVVLPVSLNAVLNGSNTRELVPPLLSPGLPASPRPFGNPKFMLGSPPLSPRGPPLSPRPPRQPIPLPPGTPLAPPPNMVSGDAASPGQLMNVAKRMTEASHQFGHTKSQSGPTGRTKVYRGLVTEEFPDLLLPPNALPSIDVKVASSRMKPSRASLMALTQLEEDPVFTLAVISRADNGELWRVEKDSASLAKLDQRLKLCPTFTARTPDRSLFSGHAPAKLDARRLALDQYMDELLNTPLDTATAVELCRYLSTNTLPPNMDEIGPVGRPGADSTSKKVDSRPTRTGYLTKKGKNFGGWKARYFVLDGPLLKYYETPGGTHLGTIKLQNAQIGKQSQGNENQSPAYHANDEDLANQYRHAFLILEPKKKDSNSHVKHVLCAESDAERDSWVGSLLPWIDYRDSNEEPTSAKLNPNDRQTHGQGTPNGGKTKKAVQVKTHHSSGSDTLIGVRYDSTHAGEAPQGAPGTRPRTAGGPDQQLAGGDLQQKIISGPKDGQIISDSAAWGNRVAPTPTQPTHPTSDEKKQRKRSFFGFGAKTRSSSDGQESMFGGSENGVSPTPPQNAFQGPVRQVFGAPLAEAVRYNAPLDVSVPLPSVVYRCIQYLESQNAILEEGIFRLSGSNVVIRQLRERFNTEGDVNIVTDEQYYDIHAVASLLKLYLRELPTSILTRDLHLEFLSTTEMLDRDEKLAILKELVLRLPQVNATLLKYLIAFLIRIINNSDVNKMTVRNVGIVFSPTLHIPAPVFAIFLQNYEAIFGIDPEEYELPSPVSDAEGGPGRPESTPRFEIADRPSTSSGSGSPHRQGWIESVRDQSRSTPTPPLLMNLNVARGSPTPSGTSRQSYETSYLVQSPRPGAISSATSSATTVDHESTNYQGQHRVSSAFDMPSPPLEEEQSGNGLKSDQHGMKHISNSQQHQGAKSRLREEAHF